MMNSNCTYLDDDEWTRLSAFGLSDCASVSPFSIETNALLDDDTCIRILQSIQPELGAPDLKVTASLVIKRVAFLTLAPLFYAMSCYDKGLNAAIDNCIFEYPLNNRLWQSRMPLKQCQVTLPLDERTGWRERVLTAAFKENLGLLVEQFHQLTRVPKAVLWENIAVRIFSIYERRIFPDVVDTKYEKVARADFRFLLDSQTTALYGVSRNPIARYFYDKSAVEDVSDSVRVRRTCCYYYKATEPAVFCSNCPLVGKRPRQRSPR